MGDGFSINLSDRDLKNISCEYKRLKNEHAKNRCMNNVVDYACTYFALDGFVKGLRYVGLDPEIFEDGIEPLE
jgi:hypothetical protein